MTGNVLIVDDDRELCELVAELLGEEGFAVEVERIKTVRGVGYIYAKIT